MSEAPAGIGKRLKDGVKIVSTLLAAAAVMRLLSGALHVPLSQWLAGILAAYTNLMHPIVDYTVGVVPALLGYRLEPATKDGIVLYSLGAGACFRSLLAHRAASDAKRESRPETSRKERFIAIVMAALWPLVLITILKDTNDYYSGRTAPIEINSKPVDLGREFGPVALRHFLKELLFILVTVAVCMILNAAGVIELPD